MTFTPPVDEAQSALYDCHGLDTPEAVYFYEQDFYVLSNFSAFQVEWCEIKFPTLEHAYHWMKFASRLAGTEYHPEASLIAKCIAEAPSAHEAFQFAQQRKYARRPDWDAVKVQFMKALLWEKVNQHEYVKRKLLATGDRELVENSWRDDFWGWGPNRDGKNMLGKLWMEIRGDVLIWESACD